MRKFDFSVAFIYREEVMENIQDALELYLEEDENTLTGKNNSSRTCAPGYVLM